VCVLQLAAMKNFNQDFQQIGEEVKKLKEVHAAAKAVSKKEQQKVREIRLDVLKPAVHPQTSGWSMMWLVILSSISSNA